MNCTIWGSPCQILTQRESMKRIDWFWVGRDWFPLVSRSEGLVSAGFKGVKTGFDWFQGGKDWLRVVSACSTF